MQGISTKLFADSAVNMDRQIEFDYLKGWLWFVILFIHAFQITGVGAGIETTAYKTIFSIVSMTGAPVFLFVLGMGTRYSQVGTARMLRSGGKLFSFQYLSNIAFVASLLIPFFVMSFFVDMSERVEIVTGATMSQVAVMQLLYMNIFFLAGGIYMVLALLRKLKTPVWLYVALGVVINIFSPMLIGLSTGFMPVDYVLGGIFGGPPFASFSILNYLPYAFFGVAFGELLKRVTDKKRFYVLCCALSAVLLAMFSVWTFWHHAGFTEVYQYISTTYTKPDIMRTVANTAGVIITAGIMFFLSGIIAKCGAVHRQLLYYSKHISKYYAVHLSFFGLVYGFHSFYSFGLWGCLVLFVLSVFYSDTIVRLYNHFSEKRKTRKIIRANTETM
ncbi:MAG: hypothetical protein FWF88_10965 [Peptococcaceae bacterium]|nr:hypothetical protein [Peptococcaceae bacterium]